MGTVNIFRKMEVSGVEGAGKILVLSPVIKIRMPDQKGAKSFHIYKPRSIIVSLVEESSMGLCSHNNIKLLPFSVRV